MVKSTKKTAKGLVGAKKTKKATTGQTKIAEYMDYLWELHKLQGELLTELGKEILRRRPGAESSGR